MTRRRPTEPEHPIERIVGNAPGIVALRDEVHRLAAFDTPGSPRVPTLLLHGETGTGKGLVARAVHDGGPRASGSFIDVNCAAIPENLLEAEMYGFEAGAFTDARRAKPGLFEAASGGTLFLDEIDALPLPLQAKLLRSIEDKRVRRLGAVTDLAVDTKIIAAAQLPLARRVAGGQFRADLYHRLALVVLGIPPLRERGDDIRLLAEYFLGRYAEAHGLTSRHLTAGATAWLRAQGWPGNVRELSHLMERATLLGRRPILDDADLEELRVPAAGWGAEPASRAAEGLAAESDSPEDRERIRSALQRSGGNVLAAARSLGMSRNALRYRMARYSIARSPRDDFANPRVTISPGSPAPSRPARAPADAPPPIWEKKPVAALAIDLTFSKPAGADSLALEPWTHARRWERAIAETVEGFGGVLLARAPSVYTVLFGVPRALDHMPQRAARSALAIRRMVEEAGGDARPEARLTVHVGEALVDTRVAAEATQPLGVGDTLALPMRLLGLASAGEIVASPQAARMLDRFFALDPRAFPATTGSAESLTGYVVMGLRPEPQPLAMSGAQPLSRFVGRQREMSELGRALDLTARGHGQIVSIVADAGVGKSRLCYEFRRVASPAGLVLDIASASHDPTHSFLPLVQLLTRYFGIAAEDAEGDRREKVTARMAALGPSLADALPFLLALLGDADAISALAQMDPPIRRQRTFEAIKRLFLRESLERPLLIIVEDLHWLDDDTAALLDVLVESVATTRVLLLVSYRPEYRHRWGSKTYYTQLRLDPLGQDEARELLGALIRDGARLSELILEKAQGNPLFIEEIVQVLVDRGLLVPHASGRSGFAVASAAGPLTALELPPTLQAVLAARIDRLTRDEKAVLQCLAVLGTEFSLDLARMVAGRPDEELEDLLARLGAAEFIYERPGFPEASYTFKHALTQEVAYDSLPLERRRELHARAARALETLSGDRRSSHDNALAHHYLHAGMTEQAVEYLARAGQQAVERSAYAEAIALLTRAVKVLSGLPDAPERRQRELVVQIALGPALMATKGFGVPEVEHVFTRARELCRDAGETPELYKVLQGLSVFHALRVKLRTAAELIEQRRRLAEQLPHPAFLPQAHIARGHVMLALGDLVSSRAALEQGMALYDPGQHHALAFGSGQDPSGRDHAALVLWLLGYPDKALASLHQAVSQAQGRPHSFSLAVAQIFAAMLHQWRGEAALAREPAEAAMALSSQHGFAMFHAMATILAGWASSMQGAKAEGLAQIQRGIEIHRAAGTELVRPYFLGLLAQAHHDMGQSAEGLIALDEALVRIRQSEERWWEAELYRLRGELLMSHAGARDDSREREAVASLETALEIARNQQAKSLELRAALSLGRLWQLRGKREDARRLLAGVYGRFTEGFGTTDLLEARTFLEKP